MTSWTRRNATVAALSALGSHPALSQSAGAPPRSLDAALAALAAREYGVSIVEHGADPEGKLPCDDALQAAIAAAAVGNGGLVYIPAGRYVFLRPHVISRQHLHIFGAGPWATTLIYRPTADDTAFLTFHAGVAISNECSLRELTIFSDDTTRNKTAIQAIDTSALSIRHVRVAGTARLGVSWLWGGGNKGSIALHLKGREATDVSDFYAYADRPLLIDRNPNMSGSLVIDIDHAHFYNLYLFATNHPCVEVTSGVNLTQVSFAGYQAWVGGTYGFYWKDTTTTQASVHLRFDNVRLEQGVDSKAYAFYIARNATLAMLSFSNIRDDPLRRGWFLRHCDDVRMESTVHEVATLALDVDASVRRLSGSNCFWQAGSSAQLEGQHLVWSTPKNPSTGALPPNFVFNEASSLTRNAESEVHHTSPTLTVAVNAILELGVSGTQGFVTVDTHENVGAIFHFNGTANSVSRSLESAPGLFSTVKDTANQVNVYWDAGSGRYLLQNKRSVTLRIKVGRNGGSFSAL